MPWKEYRVIDEKIKFVVEAMDRDESMKNLCEKYGISRKTGYKWLNRYKEDGAQGLCNRSRAPHTHPNALEEKVKKDILALKQKHPNWGPKKLCALLKKQDYNKVPAASTVGTFLKKHGLVKVKKRRRKAVPTEAPLTKALKPNDVWCADFKGHFKTRDGNKCKPLTITDQLSRYLLACHHVNRMSFEYTKDTFEKAFREYGMPLVVRTDNGTPFSSTNRYGLSKLSFWWIRLGIYPERIKLGRPDQNGCHERMHRTLKQEVASPPAQNISAQEMRFKSFVNEYNLERPHEALDMKTPSELYINSDRSYPEKLRSIEYASRLKVYRVQKHGEIKYRGRDLFISECLYKEHVGLEQISENKSVVWYCNYELGVLNHEDWKIEPLFCKPYSTEISLTYKEL